MQAALWIGFAVFVATMLVLDLGIFHRKSHTVGLKEALSWCGVWVGLALLFNVAVYYFRGPDAALKFLTGYLLEESLSVDNLFVFLLIFSYFRTPSEYQHKVLFWGIVGAVVMRALFIVAGISLIHRFHWIMYVFGIFLIFTGAKLAFEKDKEVHPEKNPILSMFCRLMPVSRDYENGKFFVRKDNRLWATPLFVVLLAVESTDVVFAMDSIPAILGITTDPFIVYTSNIFAILGLRSIYFALAGLMRLFHYLHYGLSVILVFIGIKMLAADVFKIPVAAALGVIAAVLIGSVAASLIWPEVKGDLPKPDCS